LKFKTPSLIDMILWLGLAYLQEPFLCLNYSF
jgi:hypothetical protein